MDPGITNSNASKGQGGKKNTQARWVWSWEACGKVKLAHPVQQGQLLLLLGNPRHVGTPNSYFKRSWKSQCTWEIFCFFRCWQLILYFIKHSRPNKTELPLGAAHRPPVYEPRRCQSHGLWSWIRSDLTLTLPLTHWVIIQSLSSPLWNGDNNSFDLLKG